MNHAILMGRLGKDPELRHTAAGAPVCTFSIATDETWRDSAGTKHERATWHNVVAWNKAAEWAAKYLTKGKPVTVVGRITVREWTDRAGVKRWLTEIIAERLDFALTDRGNGHAPHAAEAPSEYREAARSEPQPPAQDGAPDPSEDDIPF